MAGLHAGATVLPPMPAFYHRPETINDLLAQTSGKILDQFGIAHQLFQRWEGRSPSDRTDSALRANKCE